MSYVVPEGNRIIGKRVKSDGELKTNPGGKILIMENSAQGDDKYSIVTVLRVGPGYHSQNGSFVPTSTKPGDKVCVIKMAAFPLTQNQSDDILEPNEELVLFQESDIMFKLVDKLD